VLVVIGCRCIETLALGADGPPTPSAGKPALATFASSQRSVFHVACFGTEKDREKARQGIAAWGPLSKKAAGELRKFVATEWPSPPQPGGWKGKATATGGMRELDVPGLGKREYYLSLPPQPYTPTRASPVLLSLHGAGGNGKGEYQWCWAKWAKQWPGFIACPSGEPAGQQWFKDGTFGEDQQPFVMALLADLRKNFAVDDDRILIHGFSNGGNASWYYAMHYPSLFAGMVTRGGSPCSTKWFENLLHVPSYIVHGDKDSVIGAEDDRKAAAKLKNLAYDVTYKELPGGHNPFLNDTNPEIVTWLGKQKRKAYPLKIAFKTADVRASRAYWVEITDRVGKGAEVNAEVKENRIELTVRGVKEIVLWLSDDLVDLEQPVTVVCGGKTLHEALVPRAAADLLAWLDATGDRAAAPVVRLALKP